ncbi:MAG: phosphoglucomutase [Cyclobacteriaceae bacterium]|nr:MAG: phosphoglucomutase [Cyclobacteriaceae bacterium]
MVDQAIQQKVDQWLNSSIDRESKLQIEELQKDPKTLTDAFYKDLEFGTGGLRGIIGIGSNRINKYTIGKATQGLANYLNQSFSSSDIQVAIAYDSRNKSDYFAKVTAQVFAANGITVHLFESLRPTPELSFAIRELKCQAGIVITASHNPKEYNGYKAYWNDGAQLVPPHDKNVMAQVGAIESFDQIKFEGNQQLIKSIGTEIDEKYLSMIEGLVVNNQVISQQHDLKIVYSSIHGTGITMVPEILKRIGFSNVTIVEEQAEPDGNFPTVVYPNPEEQEAMSLALAKAGEIDADLIMATDPDTDRVGIGVKNHHGEFQLLNGNQAGVLLIHYLLDQWKANNKISDSNYIVKTIVTTNLIDDIAAAYQVDCFNTLTGFKWIAEIIGKLEGNREFIVGGEESYGYMVGEEVRDKDAVASCAILAELAAYCKQDGQSMFDRLISIYQQYGYYKESLISITKPGKSGAEEIQEIMKNLRQNPPKSFAESPIVKIMDYQSSEALDVASNNLERIELPKSNVLQFLTSDGSKISARPSGTEPKIKFYISVKGRLASYADFDSSSQLLDLKIDQIKQNLKDFSS